MLVSTCDDECFILDGHVLLQVSTLNSWPSILFYLLCEYNMSYCISFSWIYICSHTLVAPHGLQNLGGAFVLVYANHVYMIPIEIQIHAHINGELSINFGVQKF